MIGFAAVGTRARDLVTPSPRSGRCDTARHDSNSRRADGPVLPYQGPYGGPCLLRGRGWRVIDQRVTRPGPTPPPRKLHLIHRLHITPELRATLAEQELDELPDGGHEIGTSDPRWRRWTTPEPPSVTPPWTPSPTRTTPGCEYRV
ncbi:hypothetical protein [Streptomyces sp. NPDC093018]|uniref:hypothetical protein n=1 Tax=Streptomyces sp. NPDC093018 TaxID=3155067 RepID=UPI00341DD03C